MEDEPVNGAVDNRGRAATRSATGRWTSAAYIIGTEIAERSANSGISSNLITYLTGPLGQSTAAAAVATNTWTGISMLTPLAGAFVADSCLGRYATIAAASLLYVIGIGLLTLSTMVPTILPSKCKEEDTTTTSCPPLSQFQLILFYTSLYIVALAQGGHKPCVQAFGADQFDPADAQECKSRSSFFNWWYFGMSGGILFSTAVLSYIQDNVGWGLGFGIPLILVGIALILFLLGTPTYRYYVRRRDHSPFVTIGKAFLAMAASRRRAHSGTGTDDQEAPFLVPGDLSDHQIEEEAKGVLQLFPIWACCLVYGLVSAQTSTFFTKQGSTLDRRIIGNGLQVPPAALQSFITLSTLVFIPVYDRILVPAARKLPSLPSGITMLQRIGAGMAIQAVVVAVAALVEVKRLRVARDSGLIDQPDVAIPMSLWWLVPQYALSGISHVFALVGLQEFFYSQMPETMRSLGIALYLSIYGIGSFISSFLVYLVNEVTSKGGHSWFSDNLNRAHLDYFYSLLAVLNTLGLICYIYFAKSYVYKKVV